MPEKIEELSFGKHPAPVSGEFMHIVDPDPGFTKILVRLVNHSNKDITSIFVNLVYLDVNGNEIDDFPSTISGDFSFEGQEPAVTKNAANEIETTAFQMPEGTVDIRIEVNSADFIDGTTWRGEF